MEEFSEPAKPVEDKIAKSFQNKDICLMLAADEPIFLENYYTCQDQSNSWNGKLAKGKYQTFEIDEATRIAEICTNQHCWIQISILETSICYS